MKTTHARSKEVPYVYAVVFFTTVRIDWVKKKTLINFTVVSNKFFFATLKVIISNDEDGSQMCHNIDEGHLCGDIAANTSVSINSSMWYLNVESISSLRFQEYRLLIRHPFTQAKPSSAFSL